MSYYRIRANLTGEWFFELHVPGPGSLVLTGEPRGSKAEVEREIQTVRRLAGDDGAFKKRTRRHDEHYFELQDQDGTVVGSCDVHDTAARRDAAIGAVKRYAGSAIR